MFGRVESWLREQFGMEPNASLLNAAGMKLYEQGITAGAIGQFERAIAVAPYFTSAWINLAGCRAMLGDHQAAVEGFGAGKLWLGGDIRSNSSLAGGLWRWER